jgi:hypothetical protein
MSANRWIKYGDKTMPMPEHMKLEDAKAVMARHFPELAENPKIETKKDGDKTTYVFSKQAGRKGTFCKGAGKSLTPRIAKRLRQLKRTRIIPLSIEHYVIGSGTHIRYEDESSLHAAARFAIAARESLLELGPAVENTDPEADLL